MGADRITIAYGQTEASPVVTQTLADDSIERRVSTVGKVLPGVEVRLVDPETGLVVGPGQPGRASNSQRHGDEGLLQYA